MGDGARKVVAKVDIDDPMADGKMTSAFYIKERDNMPGMKGIYRFNPALVGAIIGLIIDLILCAILP